MNAKHLWLAAALILVSWASADAAFGQFLGGQYMGRSDNPNGPTVSPYLNLLQNNNQFSPVTNYQSLVKPLVDQNSAIRQQGASINRLQQQVSSPGASAPGTTGRGTGHVTYFMNYSHYYPPAQQPR